MKKVQSKKSLSYLGQVDQAVILRCKDYLDASHGITYQILDGRGNQIYIATDRSFLSISSNCHGVTEVDVCVTKNDGYRVLQMNRRNWFQPYIDIYFHNAKLGTVHEGRHKKLARFLPGCCRTAQTGLCIHDNNNDPLLNIVEAENEEEKVFTILPHRNQDFWIGEIRKDSGSNTETGSLTGWINKDEERLCLFFPLGLPVSIKALLLAAGLLLMPVVFHGEKE